MLGSTTWAPKAGRNDGPEALKGKGQLHSHMTGLYGVRQMLGAGRHGGPEAQESSGQLQSQKTRATKAKAKAEIEGKANRQGLYLEHHLKFCREGEEGTEHGSHGHEHQLKEQQASQVVHACHCVSLPRLQPEQPCSRHSTELSLSVEECANRQTAERTDRRTRILKGRQTERLADSKAGRQVDGKAGRQAGLPSKQR